MHTLNCEVTQGDSQCIKLFCDADKMPIRMQIMTAWDDCLISVAWRTEQNHVRLQFSLGPETEMIFKQSMFPSRYKYFIN